jgi:predicted transcriptional regulator
MKRAADIMTPDPACCAPTASLEVVAKLMVQHHCGEIPVADADGELIGVVTDRDIVWPGARGRQEPTGHTAQHCMSLLAINMHATRSLPSPRGSATADWWRAS